VVAAVAAVVVVTAAAAAAAADVAAVAVGITKPPAGVASWALGTPVHWRR
jgi:hypothetical protein